MRKCHFLISSIPLKLYICPIFILDFFFLLQSPIHNVETSIFSCINLPLHSNLHYHSFCIRYFPTFHRVLFQYQHRLLQMKSPDYKIPTSNTTTLSFTLKLFLLLTELKYPIILIKPDRFKLSTQGYKYILILTDFILIVSCPSCHILFSHLNTRSI